MFIELDEKGEIIGIEVWRASNVLEPIAQTTAARIRQEQPHYFTLLAPSLRL
ncbi:MULTISPECIES: DUF2283 domain-containing protein [Pyrobaculum]|uniref:DUF2283 domain-containing protein n=1 Tax=Pyrobaculum arsenaticum (strain DSM 13514 / JCM 11321 / PZ6) TaxID=340102 RepID=A4WHS6_PYRAR|nr:DUF2283 domain-containing protein [Pyrobaculum arsenaticum]ABP49943.1 hypothetical protein Pars_0332 [Pyrobaculum arsenaticum DSM 13514]MCY0891546.1 DUF2283 domain-containing protein [Pyrobaculum arsenaticum]